MHDDRIRCVDCTRLDDAGRCHAERSDVGAYYHPVTVLPLRCDYFQPLRGAADQRDGRTRFPHLRIVIVC